MVRPGIVAYTIVDFTIGIASTFRAEFPYCPILVMFVIEESDKSICGIPVGALRIGRGGARRCNDLLSVSPKSPFETVEWKWIGADVLLSVT